MALQGVIVEFAFTTTPFADPASLTWTNVSAKVLSFDVSRGRSYELTQMQAGTATVVLDNITGEFDPDNAGGSHYPNVLPLVPIRIKSLFSATTYPVFYGFVENWEQSWGADRFSYVTVTASDGLKNILAYPVGQGYTQMLVADYGGTVGTQDDFVWPFQNPNSVNSYLNAGSANVVPVGNSVLAVGIAQTGMQLSGSSSSFYWTTAAIGARGYWVGVDGWFRIDTMPGAGSVPRCMLQNANSNNSQGTPNLGFGALGYGVGDTLSAWVINYPQNKFAAAVADPTSTTNWATTLGTIATAAITTSNGRQRIYLDNGATDFYGATKAMRLTTTGAGQAEFTSPFTAVAASTAYTVQVVATQENTAAGTSFLTIDWYNGATFLSSSTIATTSTAAFGPNEIPLKVTSPASATQCKIHWSIQAPAGTNHWDLSQLVLVLGSFDVLTWYAGGTTPAQSVLFTVASYAGIHPPGQSNSATGWPCYATIAAPAAGTWFHAAVDAGIDNVGTPYSATGLRMPSLWVNGAAVRMWTPGPYAGPALNAQPWAALGAKLYFNGGGTPSIDTTTALAMSVDELYIPDANIATVGEVTAAKALAHYTYGLSRHDFPAQVTSARVNQVLDSLGWSSVQRSVDTSTITMLAQLPDTAPDGTTTGLGLIQDANTVEGGLYFVAADGKFTYWNRTHSPGATAITIGDLGSGGEVPYKPGPRTAKDDTYIFNQIVLTQKVTDGSAGPALSSIATDATSQNRYNPRQMALSAPWSTQADMDSLSAAYLANDKDPHTRIASVSVDGILTAAFASLLALEIGKQVQVNIRPRSAGPTVAATVFIQGMQLKGTATSWLWVFSLTPTIAGR